MDRLVEHGGARSREAAQHARQRDCKQRRHVPEAIQLFEIEAACRTGNGNAAGRLAAILENEDGDATHAGGEFEMLRHEVLAL